MSYRTLLLMVLFGLAACSRTDSEPAKESPSSEAGADAALSWRDQRGALGRKTYRQACGSCHDSGEGGAPVIGQRDDWSGRSDMWQAVLFEHAKAGYLDMPGKGGQEQLSDEAVEAATEYMLEQTFPELPKD
jgi:cytochrome c5